jgi:Rod binding domain-containing protein
MPDTILSLGTMVPGPAALGQVGAGKKDDPERIHGAAQQFESLLISQILKTAHDDAEGWLGTGDDAAASSAMGIAEEQFAQALSSRGGLGLARLIEKGLTRSTNAIDR